jgi:hypothetical protein
MAILQRLLHKYLAGREVFVPGEQLIMRRYILFDSDRLGLYIHHLCGLDHDALHNHPWKWSAALVFSGWYTEERATATPQTARRILRTGHINVISQRTFHRIAHVSPKGAWTLYVHGGRVQRDGFLTREDSGWTYRDARDVRFEDTRPTSRQ